MNISFFSLRFDLFSIIAKEVCQLAGMYYVLQLALFSCFAVHLLRVRSKIKRNQSFKVRISRLCYFLWLWQCLLNIFHYHNYMHQYPKYNPFPIHVSFTLTSTFIIILPLTWTRFFFIKFKFTFADTWFANFSD